MFELVRARSQRRKTEQCNGRDGGTARDFVIERESEKPAPAINRGFSLLKAAIGGP